MCLPSPVKQSLKIHNQRHQFIKRHGKLCFVIPKKQTLLNRPKYAIKEGFENFIVLRESENTSLFILLQKTK